MPSVSTLFRTSLRRSSAFLRARRGQLGQGESQRLEGDVRWSILRRPRLRPLRSRWPCFLVSSWVHSASTRASCAFADSRSMVGRGGYLGCREAMLRSDICRAGGLEGGQQGRAACFRRRKVHGKQLQVGRCWRAMAAESDKGQRANGWPRKSRARDASARPQHHPPSLP